jgi:hypothetical protein
VFIEHIESYDKDWIGPLRSNREVTYGSEEIRVDALEEGASRHWHLLMVAYGLVRIDSDSSALGTVRSKR